MNGTESPGEAGIMAYVGLGANLGDRRAGILTALRELDALPTISVRRVSSLYETAPVGVTDQPDFLNAVAAVETGLTPRALLDALLHLENRMGRVRTLRWGPRVIDLDLLLLGDRTVAEPGLAVPHPRLRERGFVLLPLAEVAPGLRLPGDGAAVSALAELFSQSGNIRRLGPV
jgi:2-amino-4-hydroxy-6-hydroxymethyldihydropteridine diphosphokinase